MGKNCILWIKKENQYNLDSIGKISKCYLNLFELVQLALIIPVSFASHEKTFSAMCRIKNFKLNSEL